LKYYRNIQEIKCVCVCVCVKGDLYCAVLDLYILDFVVTILIIKTTLVHMCGLSRRGLGSSVRWRWDLFDDCGIVY